MDYQTANNQSAVAFREGRYADTYPLSALAPVDGATLFDLARHIAPRQVFYLPRTTDLDELAQLPYHHQSARYSIHIEELWLGYRLKAIAVFYARAP